MGEVLAVLAETIRQAAILVQPVMPGSASKILDQLGVADGQRGFDMLAGAGRIAAGVEISKPEHVFPRFVEEEGEV
jgi:methionyl-tRNA synthetase